MSDISLYRTPQPLEPQLIDDKFMGWAGTSSQQIEYKLFINWPFRICLGDWSTTIYKYNNEFEAWLAFYLKLPFRWIFACFGAREEQVVTDRVFGYTPLMRAKGKYNQAVRYFNRVKNYPEIVNRYEDLVAFKQILHHLDWRAATGDIDEKLLKHLEKMVADFEARYYPKQLDGSEATKLLSEIKP